VQLFSQKERALNSKYFTKMRKNFASMFGVYCATKTFGQKCIEQKLTKKKINLKTDLLFLYIFQ
jgi:hypothetical protein